MWPHLERTSGGIGSRGPGETQLETDRRLLDRRLRRIKRDLQDLEEEESLRREKRKGSGLLRVSLWGYTNSGKSTLASSLGAKGSLPSSEIFSTIDPRTRRIELRTHTALLTDTVGIVDRMPEKILSAFRSTLHEVVESDLLIHVLSATNWKRELRVGRRILGEIGLGDRRSLVVVNGPASNLPDDFVHIDGDPAPLRAALERDYLERSEELELIFPYAFGGSLSALYRESSVVERRDEGNGTWVKALVLPERKHLFQDFLL